MNMTLLAFFILREAGWKAAMRSAQQLANLHFLSFYLRQVVHDAFTNEENFLDRTHIFS